MQCTSSQCQPILAGGCGIGLVSHGGGGLRLDGGGGGCLRLAGGGGLELASGGGDGLGLIDVIIPTNRPRFTFMTSSIQCS